MRNSTSNLWERLIYMASLAPSPENNQPWRFKQLEPNSLEVLYDSSSALCSDPLNILNTLSIGAALENLSIAAEHEGYETYFEPSSQSLGLVTLKEGGTQNPLYHYITRRCTNRGYFDSTSLASKLVEELENDAITFNSKLVHIADPKSLRRLARVLGILEGLRLSSIEYTKEMRNTLRFSAKELKQNDGIPADSLALDPIAYTALRLASHPVGLKFLQSAVTKIGIAQHIERTIKHSGGLMILTVYDLSTQTILQAGRALERIWLKCTQAGVGVHPLGVFPVFSYLTSHPKSLLNEAASSKVKKYCNEVSAIAKQADNLVPALLFRIGYCTPPTARAWRRLPTANMIINRHSKKGTNDFSYQVAFTRNIGLVSRVEQDRLRHTTVALPGLGGVGGLHLLTLARMGFGRFHIADFDEFSLANMNRQHGAFMSTIGQDKLKVMTKMVQDINPEVQLKTWSNGLNEENIERFLFGADVVIDSIDAFSIEMRRTIINMAKKMGIPVISAGPIGFSCAMLIFLPDSPDYEQFFPYNKSADPLQNFAGFVVGLIPHLKPFSYLDRDEIDSKERCGPSSAAAVALCAGHAAIEALRIILHRGRSYAVPWYHYYDPYLGIFKRRRIFGGSRNGLQKLKRKLLYRNLVKTSTTKTD